MHLWRRRKSSGAPKTTTASTGRAPQHRLNFADSLDEALRRFALYKSDDPFPEIPPALLNSADIADYVATTGMIYPFDADGLKTASYSVPLLGEVVHWDEKDEMHVLDLRAGEAFRLMRNSIAFVTLEPEFHLPDYMALRFNLKIPNVYKGLLLGTGPLVDPGWEGRLSIPLHNLTTNPYDFLGGDGLIWMEFTKLSPNQRWAKRQSNAHQLRGEYIPFPEDKKFGSVRTRLRAAAPDRPVSSSLAAAHADARNALATAQNLSKWIRWGGAIATIVGLGTIVALAVDILAFRDNSGSNNPAIVVVDQSKVQRLERQVLQLRNRVTVLEGQRKPKSK
jgi:deoxycytidine triphosphate deaminase